MLSILREFCNSRSTRGNNNPPFVLLFHCHCMPHNSSLHTAGRLYPGYLHTVHRHVRASSYRTRTRSS
eukprot:COSAG01_NODE_341_length_18611_cov_31.251513_6_plen_68_part_00